MATARTGTDDGFAAAAAAAAQLVPPPALRSMVQQWLAEDAPSFDVGGAVVGDKPETAHLLAKADGVLAGVPFFNAVFAELGCSVQWHVAEGSAITLPQGTTRLHCATIQGPARLLLLGERVALNLLARASGIATRSRHMALRRQAKGWPGLVAGTRKTTCGFRLVEKHAMIVGGCDPHRMDLSSMVMLKDNHIWSQGSITRAVQTARSLAGFSMKIEVECANVDQAREAIAAGADVVMLDNLAPGPLATAAAALKRESPHILIEASGGITAETIEDYMCAGVDIISTSWIHQGTPHVDFSLKIQPGP